MKYNWCKINLGAFLNFYNGKAIKPRGLGKYPVYGSNGVIGTLNQNIIHPREIFVDAISDRAAGIIFIHNHPSGIFEPSEEDKKITKKLVEVGKLIGIEVFDHIIISKNGYYSFRENGLLNLNEEFSKDY